MKNILIIILCLLTWQSVNGQDTIRNFIFGHSLLDHRPPAIPTPSDETTVPHWLHLLSVEAGKYFAGTGQYGFLPQHDNLPPIAQWGYDIVPPVWESDTEDFDEVDFNSVLITAGNFMQWQGPDEDYPGEPEGTNPLSSTISIVDWLENNSDSMKIIIYENWPDMAGYMESFPPSDTEFANYNAYTTGEFHDWWIEYHDSLIAQRPLAQVKLVPVGPIIAELLSTAPYSEIDRTEIYEDDAPHGRASLYFLASVITYMAITEMPAPSSFQVPDIVHETIADNYIDIVNYAWNYLTDFNDDQGNSRVFLTDNVINGHALLAENNIQLFPNPTSGIFHIKGATSDYVIEVLNSMAAVYQTYDATEDLIINIEELPSGMYFVKMTNKINGQLFVKTLIKE
ncbi:T9SS type A sorting domain-containing protein [Saprospiraceae bacterium]|nr:T9SS type A sorting domain-containing protein [Saprospiraceae bacterium]